MGKSRKQERWAKEPFHHDQKSAHKTLQLNQDSGDRQHDRRVEKATRKLKHQELSDLLKDGTEFDKPDRLD